MSADDEVREPPRHEVATASMWNEIRTDLGIVTARGSCLCDRPFTVDAQIDPDKGTGEAVSTAEAAVLRLIHEHRQAVNSRP